MNKEELLKKVLEKYKISMPLNPAIRKHIMKSRRRVLINIFKYYGQYNIVIAAALVLYFPLRKIGVTANLVQSAVIMFTVTTLTIASIITGSYFSVKKIIFIMPIEKQINEEQLKHNNIKPQINKEIPIDKFENKIIFPGFKSDTADKTIVNKLNAEILKELYLVRGQGNIIKPSPEGKGVIIVSSLEIIESKTVPVYLIMIKAVNMETSQILIIKEDTGKSSELSEKSINIIKEILKIIK